MSAVLDPAVSSALTKIQRLGTDWRYAAENLYHILDMKRGELVKIRLNEAQVRLEAEIKWFEKRRRPVRLWILKSRRAGLSTGVLCRVYHRVTNVENTNALIVANQDIPARNLLQICRIIWMKQDPRFRPPLPAHLANVPPKDHMDFPTLNSGFRTGSSKSLNQFVSFGFKIVVATECARYTQGDELFSAIYPTLSTDPQSMFFGESTALGQGTWFHENCLNAKLQQGDGEGEYGGFRLLFIAVQDMVKSYSIAFEKADEKKRFIASMTKEESDIQRVYPQCSYEFFKWRRSMFAGAPYNRNPDQFDQDFPMSFDMAFLASGSSIFGKSTIKRLSMRVRDPEFMGDIYWGTPRSRGEKGSARDEVRRPQILSEGDAIGRGFPSNVNDGRRRQLKIFRKPRKNERIFVGGDVANGDPNTPNGDFSTLVVIAMNENGGSDEVIMTWRGKCNPVVFAELGSALCWWIREQVGDSVMAPLLTMEWNREGGRTVNYEIDLRNLYDNNFRYFDPGKAGSKPTNHLGWDSNDKTKPIMVDIMCRHVQLDLIDIPDAEMISEMSNYRRTNNIEGDGFEGIGGHDDLVSAFGIALVTMRRQDLNYGHHSGDQLSAADRDDLPTAMGEAPSAWDPYDAREPLIRTISDLRLMTSSGMIDLERAVAGGDWRDYEDARDDLPAIGAFHDDGRYEDWS